MNKKSKKNTQEKLWFFDVTDPTLHPKGFTIYKVTCKVFPIAVPEELTEGNGEYLYMNSGEEQPPTDPESFARILSDPTGEIVLWKRYNDFKELHKSLVALHKALHRRDEFPVFARPKLFGRFDESVIEERKQSALDLLEFVGRFPHLYTAPSFCKFLENGKKIENNSRGVKNILIPSVLDPVPVGYPEKTETADSSSNLPPVVPVENIENVTLTVEPQKENKLAVFLDSMDKGTWNFPQPPDNISIDSFDDTDSVVTDVDSSVNSPLPDTDLSFFDPLKSDMKIPENTQLRPSKSWLFDALNTCAEIDAEEQESSTRETTDGGIQIHFTEESLSATNLDKVSKLKSKNDTDEQSSQATSSEVDIMPSSTASSTVDVTEFDPLRDHSSLKVQIGKGDFEYSISESGSSRSTSFSDAPRSTSTQGSPAHNLKLGNQSASTSPSKSPTKKFDKLSRSPVKSRSSTNESVSNMDMGNKDDYIHLAAQQICKAQECEASGMFEIAFAQYKTGVGILLQGVQVDKNKSRRDAVRRKTAQYLMKAEDIYNRYLAKETVDERRWAVDSLLSPTLDVDPTLTFIRAPAAELRNYKVLGTVGKALLVMDRTTDETYVMKTLRKSCTTFNQVQTILPTSCPFMVNLYKFFETENAVFLLLQYASGGKLWEYVGAYLHYGKHLDETQANKDQSSGLNVYSGFRLSTDEDDVLPNNKNKQTHENSSSTKEKPLSLDSTCVNKSARVGALDKVISPDEICSNSYVQLFAHKHGEEELDINIKYQKRKVSSNVENKDSQSTVDDSSHTSNVEQMGKKINKISLSRKCSGLSDDVNDCDTDLKSESFSEKYSVPEDHFQDILKNHNSSLEKFSFTSSDEEFVVSRQNSSTVDNIESIPELCENVINSESDDVFPSKIRNEVKTERTWSKVNYFSPPDVDDVVVSEANDILLNSRALLHSVDRTLSQAKEEIEEPSIYDMHRTSDSSESSSIKTHSPSKAPDEATNTSDEKTSPNSETSDSTSENKNVTNTPQLVLNDSLTKRRRNLSGKNLTLCRINSKELTRSASFESELKSPTKNRSRTVSTVFQELDALASQPDQIKIPETCIKQWAAEIVVCVARLHSMGIICRDLNPDNILLGDRGHVILTYFCQIGQCDNQIDEVAREMLYVAPDNRYEEGFLYVHWECKFHCPTPFRPDIFGPGPCCHQSVFSYQIAEIGEVSHWTQYSEACDWWSVGAIIYELLVGRSLYSCHPAGVTSHTHLLIPSHVSLEASRLLQELLHYNPKERLGGGINSSEEIKAHPFFYGIDWHILES